MTEEDRPITRITHRFAPYLHGQAPLLIGALAALLITTLMRLLEPWPLAYLVDHILKQHQHGSLTPHTAILLAAAAVILIAALRALAGYLSTISFARIGTQVLSRVRRDLYDQLLQLPLAYHQKMRPGDLTLRLVNDINQLKEITVSALLPMLANIFILLGMLGVMIVINWQLALIALLPLPVMWYSARRSSRLIHEASRRTRKREGSLAATAAESMNAIRTVQSLTLEENFRRQFSGSDGSAMHADLSTKRLSAGLERTTDLLVACATALVLWQGARQVIAGAISTGDLLVFISYLKNSMRPVREYAKYAGRLSKALASAERIADILDETPAIADTPYSEPLPKPQGRIHYRNIHFAYTLDGPKILDGLDLELAPGEHTAIVGPSGIGKSTLAALLLRLYDPHLGRIEIDGRDIRNYRLADLRSHIALLPQDALLFATSIRDNIACAAGRDVTDAEITAAAKLANAHDFIQKQPEGYDTQIGERGSTLSGGQRQRIAVARAALRQSPIIVLDEPTTGLDRHSETIVRHAIERLIKGRTALMITHDLDLAASADRIIYIEQGKIGESGSHAELLAKNGLYASLWRMHRAAVERTGDDTPAADEEP